MILAHAGGLDELLYFSIPIILYLLFRTLKLRRQAPKDPDA